MSPTIGRNGPQGPDDEQPYAYRMEPLHEPDWRRFPGWRDVTEAEWRNPQWQRVHCVRNVRQLRAVVGEALSDAFFTDLADDQAQRATMSLLLPPQMLNTIAPHAAPEGPGSLTESFVHDPVRRYMLPLGSDRTDPALEGWASHPFASRDSLHEQDMWVTEGLVHRYPTKVLAELLSTCPQYCGHCTRMDLVGNSVPQVAKLKFAAKPADRLDAMLEYLASSPGIRDVVVSGGDVANVPWPRLEAFVSRLLELENIRDIRLASKALIGLPQHWLDADVLAGLERLAATARSRGVSLALHTHANAAQSVTPLVAEAARAVLATGIRDVRNQGVLLRGVNDSPEALLDLCFALADHAGVTPYYFYMCDMIPNAEHWRVALHEAQWLQTSLLGWLPGFSTPRIVCDVPLVGKRWVHQATAYDRVLGVSHWDKNYRTRLDTTGEGPGDGAYVYYDPIHTLPEEGRAWWRERWGTAAAGATGALPRVSDEPSMREPVMVG
ncbi:KamA family radical SAM protein [Streptomyces sp. MAR25Y5]|uniref:KamA family radical SAM protein n=1 Tax=Streptomyces sp. MAR25Y5 TaxID=2962028 RepID=UPI0020B7A02E|nr:lysine 2,3-aminomutase [Streptomyces sp. MAR25Y5]MCP3771076.1 lysine 2,3-aminomutase [Streptomyces sp. MAR25Y5]